MAQHQAPAEVSPQQLKSAHTTWVRFMLFTKWSVIAVLIILALMAATLL